MYFMYVKEIRLPETSSDGILKVWCRKVTKSVKSFHRWNNNMCSFGINHRLTKWKLYLPARFDDI